MTESQESFLGADLTSQPSQESFLGGSEAGGGIDSAAFLASTSMIVQLRRGSGCSVTGFFLKQQLQQLLSQQSQLQLVTPIMTRMTARRKKTRPERLYTMAEVVEMETEDSVITVTHAGRNPKIFPSNVGQRFSSA